MQVWISGSSYGYDNVRVIFFNKKTLKKKRHCFHM